MARTNLRYEHIKEGQRMCRFSAAEQAQLADKDKNISRLRMQLEQQHADIEGLRNQYRTAQQNYDRQVHCSLRLLFIA